MTGILSSAGSALAFAAILAACTAECDADVPLDVSTSVPAAPACIRPVVPTLMQLSNW